MNKSINQELKKALFSRNFNICIIITFLLCFTSKATSESDSQYLSVINIILTKDADFVMSFFNLNTINVFQSGAGSWLRMFIPIVAALPVIPLFCDERSGGAIRNSIVRQGKLRYNLSKCFSAVISAGLAVMIGYALFGIVISFIFPPPSYYPRYDSEFIINSFKEPSNFALHKLFEKCGFVTVILAQLMQMFLYGAVSVIPAMVLSSIVKNKYIIMCVPFLIKYVYDELWVKITLCNYQTNRVYDLYNVFNSNSILTFLFTPVYLIKILFVNLGLIVAGIILFNFLMNRRRDLGA